jgi:hypothetical protein
MAPGSITSLLYIYHLPKKQPYDFRTIEGFKGQNCGFEEVSLTTMPRKKK